MTRKSTTQTKTNGQSKPTGVDRFLPYAKDVMALTGESLDVCRSQATLSLKHPSIGRARVIIFSGSPESLTICSVFLLPTDKDVKISSLNERYVTLKNPTAKQVTSLGTKILKRAGLIKAKGKASKKRGEAKMSEVNEAIEILKGPMGPRIEKGEVFVTMPDPCLVFVLAIRPWE